jgi:hypothetical protein
MTETNNSKFQAECSYLRSSFLTIIEQLDSKLQVTTENITAVMAMYEPKQLPHCQNQKTRKFCKRNYAGLKVAQLEL